MKPICFHVLLHALHFGIFHIFTLLLDAHVHVVTCESEGAFDQRKFSQRVVKRTKRIVPGRLGRGGGTVGGSRHSSSDAQSSDGGRRQHVTLLHFSHVSVCAFCLLALQYMCIPHVFGFVSFHSFCKL